MLFDYTAVSAETVAAGTDDALARAEQLVERATASLEAPSLSATLEPLELAGAIVAEAYGRGAFLGQVHPDSAVREAGRAADERLTKWRVALPFRTDLYRAVRAFADTGEAAGLDGEDRRLLEHWLRDFRRAGQELPGEQRDELARRRDRLVELEVAFQRNVNEYRDGIDVTRDELAGLPDDYVARLKPGTAEGTYRVSLDYPEIGPFLELADDRGLREQLLRKSWNKAADVNRPLLAEALRLRSRIAELLAAPTWAHHALEVRMAARPDRVQALYDEMLPALEGGARRDVAVLTELLHADGHDGPLQTWDWAYYDRRQQRTEHGVDQTEVSDYLPLDTVFGGLLEITGEVFGLDYRRVDEAHAWHPDVRLYEIRDRAGGELLAHFYADLFPREGKFGHAAAWPLVVGHRRADGGYEPPVSAIVANFTAPTPEQPSLLTHGPHGEVATLWHEFGHVLHMSLTRAHYARFSAAQTEWDFVEAPSQIMEHWVWRPEVLARITRHKATGEPMPEDLVERVVGARYVDAGLRYARQAFYGLLDLALHGDGPQPDLDAAIRQAAEVTQLPYPEGTFMLGGFAHIMGGYDAGYYGYLWAEVIGDDMFGRFEREGVLSPIVGADWRRAVLEPNGSRDGDALVEAFLGRPYSSAAFLHRRGLAPATDPSTEPTTEPTTG